MHGDLQQETETSASFPSYSLPKSIHPFFSLESISILTQAEAMAKPVPPASFSEIHHQGLRRHFKTVIIGL